MPRISVTIDGRAYRMACGEGEEAHLTGLAEDLGARVARMRADFGEIGDMRLHVMAALTLADELSDLRGRLGALEGQVAALTAAAEEAERAGTDGARRTADRIGRAADRIGRLADALSPGRSALSHAEPAASADHAPGAPAPRG